MNITCDSGTYLTALVFDGTCESLSCLLEVGPWPVTGSCGDVLSFRAENGTEYFISFISPADDVGPFSFIVETSL